MPLWYQLKHDRQEGQTVTNERKKRSLAREAEPSQETENGLEISVPKADEFFGLLKKATRKAAPGKPSRPGRE